jgi:VWFA-related protein
MTPTHSVVALAVALSITLGEPKQDQQELPQFRATVDRVRIDVIVTDEDGSFVTDLRPEELVLYEDGEPQPILGFQLVDLAAGETSDLGAERLGPGEVGAFQVGESSGPLAASDPDSLGAMIFLVDGPSLDMNVRARFSRAWAEILARTNEFDIPRAVYFISDVGEVEELAPLTLDVEALREAATAVGALPTYGPRWSQRFREMLEDIGNSMGGRRNASNLIAARYAAEDRARSIATLELLAAFCDALVARPGRTALVLISTGIMLTEEGPASALIAASQELSSEYLGADAATEKPWGYLSPDPRLLDLQNEVHEAANTANVSIYSIDPTPLGELRGAGYDATAEQGWEADLLGSAQVQSALEGTRDSLRNAAEATGGKALIHWTDVEAALEEIRIDTGRFYLVTYAPAAAEKDGEYHDVRVEVLRPGVTVRERGGYVAIPDDLKEERTISAALALPGAVRELQVEAEAYLTWTTQGQAIVQIAVNIEGEVTQGMIESGSRVELHLVVLDSDRNIVRQTSQGGRSSSFSSVPATARRVATLHFHL